MTNTKKIPNRTNVKKQGKYYGNKSTFDRLQKVSVPFDYI